MKDLENNNVNSRRSEREMEEKWTGKRGGRRVDIAKTVIITSVVHKKPETTQKR